MTSNNVRDAAVRPSRLQRLLADEALESLTADGADNTQPVNEAVIEYGLTSNVRMLEYAKAVSLFIAILQLPHAGGWSEAFGSAGMTTGENQDALHQTAGRASVVQNL